ncbi:MAG: hypothetical protein HXL34_04265 [Prevotellaceae bacterium]|nr:hypothetical protein [Prevotellaceae bacterium]
MPLRWLCHCSAAVSSVVDGRHTHCSTAAVRAADGRRTTNITLLFIGNYLLFQRKLCTFAPDLQTVS